MACDFLFANISSMYALSWHSFPISSVQRLEEKECTDKVAALESYRKMRDAMVQMQVEAENLAEAQ